MSVNTVSQDTGELTTLSSGVRMWVGTRAAHTIAIANHTIPNNVMVCITDDWKNKDDYSTEETDTGKHWIDGKPVYRKVVDCGALPNTTTKSIATGLANLSTVISIKGIAQTANAITCVPIPYVSINASDASYGIACYFEGGYINLTTFRDMTVYTTTYIVVEYTKSTDD